MKSFISTLPAAECHCKRLKPALITRNYENHQIVKNDRKKLESPMTIQISVNTIQTPLPHLRALKLILMHFEIV